jgi:hypothetical protein
MACFDPFFLAKEVKRLRMAGSSYILTFREDARGLVHCGVQCHACIMRTGEQSLKRWKQTGAAP